MDSYQTLLNTALGVFLGAGVVAVGFLYKQSVLSKKDYRELIYELMGIHSSISMAQNFTAEKYLKACENIFSKQGMLNKDEGDAFKLFLLPIIKPQIQVMTQDLSNWNEKAYLEKVSKIAALNPILAHRLKTNTTLENITNTVGSYLNNYITSLEKAGVNTEDSEAVLPKMEEEVVKIALLELEKDILLLGWSVSTLQFLSLYFWLKTKKRTSLEEIMNPIITNLFNKLPNKVSQH